MKKIKIKNLNKAFGNNIIFKNLTFELEKGKTLVVIGDSGSGKSTLLQCIGLLEIADSGILEIDNFLIDFTNLNQHKSDIKKIKSKIGMVFQDFNLWPHMSVIQNLIEAPIQVKKEEKSKAIERALKLLKELNIENKAYVMPETLSGGQKQRVAIARSLMMKPEIMLFDEPTSALDPKMVSVLIKIVKKLANDGITLIIASHEISFAKQIADNVIFISNKSIMEEGNSQILDNPNSEELKEFLNSEKN